MNKIETINDFLKNPLYDFSNEKATDAYCKKEGMEKFFAYMTCQHKKKFSTNDVDILFQEAAKKVEEKAATYGNVIDADSNSALLQEIYKKLWSDAVLQFCKEENNITGDTLNSVNTTLNLYYKYLEDEFDKGKEEIETERYKRESLKNNENKKQNVSIKFILAKYYEGKSPLVNTLLQNTNLIHLVSSYHTLGNFMPIPVNCNRPKNNGIAKDYLDITLLCIYKYYIENDLEAIEKLVGDKAPLFRKWLNAYGKGIKGWYSFIEKNYLQDFVHSKEEKYYPKELWEEHFKQIDALPSTIEQCNEYFENASKCILSRGNRMIEALKNVLKTK